MNKCRIAADAWFEFGRLRERIAANMEAYLARLRVVLVDSLHPFERPDVLAEELEQRGFVLHRQRIARTLGDKMVAVIVVGGNNGDRGDGLADSTT
jgi:hypothetical protein